MSETERKDAAGLSAVKDFSLPRYAELPNFGLYLEQALKVINEALSPEDRNQRAHHQAHDEQLREAWRGARSAAKAILPR